MDPVGNNDGELFQSLQEGLPEAPEQRAAREVQPQTLEEIDNDIEEAELFIAVNAHFGLPISRESIFHRNGQRGVCVDAANGSDPGGKDEGELYQPLPEGLPEAPEQRRRRRLRRRRDDFTQQGRSR